MSAAATLININRCKDNVRVSSVLTCKLFKLRSQGNTRSAPSRSEFNHYGLVSGPADDAKYLIVLMKVLHLS